MRFLDKLFGRGKRPADPHPAEPEPTGVVDEGEVGDDSTPGWDAISAAFDALYPDQPSPKHFGTLLRWRIGGNDPLDGVSVYRSVVPRPHWHYVSYGLSDLYGEETGRRESGFGLELTFRLVDPSAADPEGEPPFWPISLMQNLARYVFQSGNVLNVGDHLDANGPIFTDSDTQLTALLFVQDPLAGKIETPSGSLTFTQLLGITAADLDDVRDWNAAGLAALLAERDGGITDLGSASLREDPSFARRIEQGKEEDGSSVGFLYVETLSADSADGRLVVTLDRLAAEPVARSMSTRLAHGRELRLVGGERVVTLVPSDEPSPPVEREGGFSVPLTAAQRNALAAGLNGGEGEVTLADGSLVFAVAPSASVPGA